jgi:hypothetical protein
VLDLGLVQGGLEVIAGLGGLDLGDREIKPGGDPLVTIPQANARRHPV